MSEHTVRNVSKEKLTHMAAHLAAQGFTVGPVVVPENVWVEGVPYFHTNASFHHIQLAAREAVTVG